MIEFPEDPAPNGVEVELMDFGMLLRPSTGASVLRVNRAGSRFRATVSYPPMRPDTARKFVARLQRAKVEGLRIVYPLLDLSQGSPGTPLVDGAGQSGTSVNLKGLSPGYAVKEGYPLTLIDGDGLRYLHFAADAVMANASGLAAVELTTPLRAPMPDEATVLLAKPTIEGALVESVGWSLSVDRLIRLGGSIVIEESAGLSTEISATFDMTSTFTFDEE